MNKNINLELENLEIYKQIVNHMTESLWIWDKDNNTIYTNGVFCELTWYSQNEVIWKPYSDFWDKESADTIEKINKKYDISENIKYEALLRDKKGEDIPVLCSWTPTVNWWTVLMISDLRELNSLKQVEKDLRKINQTKDEFISIVWHELRTPLTSIMWYLSMILDWDMWDINTDVRKSLFHSYNSSVRLIKLVNDILSIWKIESWKMEYHMDNVDIMKLIKSTYKDIYLEVSQKWISLKVDFDKNLEWLEINTDKDKLKQVLLNLLTNAIKFTKKGWEVTIKASKIDDKVRFEIIDTWVWIPKDKLDILFDKFSQVESSMQRENTSGLGLWLSISKRFIEEFGSEIKVESEEKKWSVFYFDLKLNS